MAIPSEFTHIPQTTYAFNERDLKAADLEKEYVEQLAAVTEDLAKDEFIEHRDAIKTAVRTNVTYIETIDQLLDEYNELDKRIKSLTANLTTIVSVLSEQQKVYEVIKKITDCVKSLSTPIAITVGTLGGGLSGIVIMGVVYAITSGTQDTAESHLKVLSSPGKSIKDLELPLPPDTTSRIDKTDWYSKCLALQQLYKTDENKSLGKNLIKANSIGHLLAILNQNERKEVIVRKICDLAKQRIDEITGLQSSLNKTVDEAGLKNFLLSVIPNAASKVADLMTSSAAFVTDKLPGNMKRKAENSEAGNANKMQKADATASAPA